jgi:hypothetical protein
MEKSARASETGRAANGKVENVQTRKFDRPMLCVVGGNISVFSWFGDIKYASCLFHTLPFCPNTT